MPVQATAGHRRFLAGASKVVGRWAKSGDDTFRASSVNHYATWYFTNRGEA
jgi:hypothetical protein